MVTDPITEESGSIIILHNLESIKVFESLGNWKHENHAWVLNSVSYARLFNTLKLRCAKTDISKVHDHSHHGMCVYTYIRTGLFEMIVGVLTTCHTQYT